MTRRRCAGSSGKLTLDDIVRNLGTTDCRVQRLEYVPSCERGTGIQRE